MLQFFKIVYYIFLFIVVKTLNLRMASQYLNQSDFLAIDGVLLILFLLIFADKLNLRKASDYKYLNQSDCLTIEGVNEALKFNILMVRKQY